LQHVTKILFYSARTAEVFASLVGKLDLTGCQALCISQKTAEKLSSLKWKDILIAQKPDEESLFSLLN
jgi:uroporphyrinogen-III synthase